MYRIAVAGLLAFVPAVPTKAEEPPRLVVQLTFDQMRGDLLDRYYPALTGGLRRMMDQGYWVRAGTVDHGLTVSWPGHATLATGLTPARHGWTANEWWMEVDGQWREVDAASDPAAHVIGREDRPGKSAAGLLALSIGDWFKASNPSAKVIAIGSDAAVPYAGRTPDGVFWYDGAFGGYTTSTNYASRLPAWVESLNVSLSRLPDTWEYSGEAQWRALALHPQQCAPFGPASGLPHRFEPGGPERSAHAWRGSTPLVDEALLRHAAEIVRANGMGADDVPDYLSLALGSTDAVGHEYGPVSIEQLDTFIRLDRALGAFLDELDETIGEGRYVVALSADHGAADPPENYCEHRVTTAEIEALLDRIEVIAADHTGPQTSLVRAIERELAAAPFVGEVYSADRLGNLRAGDEMGALAARSYRAGHVPSFPLWSNKPRLHHPARYGLFVNFRPGMIFDAATSVHGSPYAYDRMVPVVLFGQGIPRKTIASGARTIDVAPTLAALANVRTPERLDGKALLGGWGN